MNRLIIGKRRLTGSATTLPHLIRIKEVAQWFLVRFGNLSLSDDYFS
jgi:hypothetical protein